MSLYDLYKKHVNPEPKVTFRTIEGEWACPNCGEVADNPQYDEEKGVVVNLCDDHPDQTIYIGGAWGGNYE